MCGIDPRPLWAALLSLACVGCAGVSAPEGFLAGTTGAQTDAYGGWIEVTYRAGAETAQAEGELIAMDADSVWVLTDGGGRAFATADLFGGRLTAYDPGADNVGLLTFVGTVSTISNGAFLIFTAPMWLIGGAVASNSQSDVGVSDLVEVGWEEARRFARFPQGMPPRLSLAQLEPKPRGER